MNVPVEPLKSRQATVDARRGLKTQLLKALVLLTAIVVVSVLVQTADARHLTAWLQKLSLSVAELGWSAPIVFLAMVALLTAIGVPRLLLCVASGAAFGFGTGLLLGLAGSLVGSYASFTIARWCGREYLLGRWRKLEPLSVKAGDKGLLSVVLMRLLPLGSLHVSVLLGITTVSHRQFLLGSALGFIPEAVPATLVGAGAVQAEVGTTIRFGLLAALLLGLLGLGLWWLTCSARSPLSASREDRRTSAGRDTEPGRGNRLPRRS